MLQIKALEICCYTLFTDKSHLFGNQGCHVLQVFPPQVIHLSRVSEVRTFPPLSRHYQRAFLKTLTLTVLKRLESMTFYSLYGVGHEVTTLLINHLRKAVVFTLGYVRPALRASSKYGAKILQAFSNIAVRNCLLIRGEKSGSEYYAWVNSVGGWCLNQQVTSDFLPTVLICSACS